MHVIIPVSFDSSSITKCFTENKPMSCMLYHQVKSKCKADTCSKKGSGHLRNQQRQLVSQCLLERVFGY